VNFKKVVDNATCPHCNRPKGKGCRTPNGAPVWPPHDTRVQLYTQLKDLKDKHGR